MARGFWREGSWLLAVTGSGQIGVGDHRGAGWASSRAQGGSGREALWETHLAVRARLLEDPNKTERETPLPPSDSAGTRMPGPYPSPSSAAELTPDSCLEALGLCPALPPPTFPQKGNQRSLTFPSWQPLKAGCHGNPPPPALVPLLHRNGRWLPQEPPWLFPEDLPQGDLNGQVAVLSARDLTLFPSSLVSSFKDSWST